MLNTALRQVFGQLTAEERTEFFLENKGELEPLYEAIFGHLSHKISAVQTQLGVLETYRNPNLDYILSLTRDVEALNEQEV